jgi:hypothetical protein
MSLGKRLEQPLCLIEGPRRTFDHMKYDFEASIHKLPSPPLDKIVISLGIMHCQAQARRAHRPHEEL